MSCESGVWHAILTQILRILELVSAISVSTNAEIGTKKHLKLKSCLQRKIICQNISLVELKMETEPILWNRYLKELLSLKSPNQYQLSRNSIMFVQ